MEEGRCNSILALSTVIQDGSSLAKRALARERKRTHGGHDNPESLWSRSYGQSGWEHSPVSLQDVSLSGLKPPTGVPASGVFLTRA